MGSRRGRASPPRRFDEDDPSADAEARPAAARGLDGIQGPYAKFGVIEGEIDPATFIDDSSYEAANDFDPAEVKAAIDEWKAANPDLLQP